MQHEIELVLYLAWSFAEYAGTLDVAFLQAQGHVIHVYPFYVY